MNDLDYTFRILVGLIVVPFGAFIHWHMAGIFLFARLLPEPEDLPEKRLQLWIVVTLWSAVPILSAVCTGSVLFAR